MGDPSGWRVERVGRGGGGWGRGEGEVRWVGKGSSFGLVGRCTKRWARKVLRAGC